MRKLAAIALVSVPVILVTGYSGSSVRSQIIRAASNVVPYKREHAINKIVTQGRAFALGYSSCGDLWNYVLDVIGAPNSWVNRTSPRRGTKWEPAVNISKPWGAALATGAAKWWHPGGPWPKAGDLVLIGHEPDELAHVFVVLAKTGPRSYRTAEYGAMNNAGKLGKRTFTKDGRNVGGWNRKLVGWIDASKIPTTKKFRPGAVRSLLHVTAPERQVAA